MRLRPTEAEFAILRVIWERGPSTVREIHDVLGRTGYTTVLKLLQIMHDKRLVQRDESGRTHVYRARISERQTQRQLVRDLLSRAFDGSAAKLIMHALASRRASPHELAEIKKLIEKATRSRHGS